MPRLSCLFYSYTKLCNDPAQSCNAKNILRIYEAENCQKVKNTEAETKKHYPYKKKSVYSRKYMK